MSITEFTGLSFEEVKEIALSKNQPAFRAKQLFNWVYRKKIFDFSAMKNLPDSLIKILDTEFIFPKINFISKDTSSDGTVKYLFELSGGHQIETVVIPGKNRITVCLSTQIGCKYGCDFCMSGKDGFKRNLTAGEIVMQLLEAENLTSARRISNVVFMGIGEPLDNYDNLIKAIKIIMDKKGLAVGKRKITVSTVGIPDKIKKLADEHLGINLSISLHSADDNKRSSFMPINRKYNLRELIFSLKEYQSKEDIPITFEYLLIGGLNDSKIDAETLSMYVKGIDSKVNLIVYNPIPAIDFHRSAASKVDFFKETLEKNKVFVTIRKERGSDIDAACGQLKSGNNKKDVS